MGLPCRNAWLRLRPPGSYPPPPELERDRARTLLPATQLGCSSGSVRSQATPRTRPAEPPGKPKPGPSPAHPKPRALTAIVRPDHTQSINLLRGGHGGLVRSPVRKR